MRPSDAENFLAIADVVAQRSLCSRAQVGAVIVSLDQIIVSTGRNGPPRFFQHNEQPCTSWCERAKQADEYVWAASERLLTSPISYELYTNSRGTYVRKGDYEKMMETDEDWERAGFEKVRKPGLSMNYATCPSIHAEGNALLSGDRSARMGGTIYVTTEMCWECCKLVANSGLSQAVVRYDPESYERRGSEQGYRLLKSVNVSVWRFGMPGIVSSNWYGMIPPSEIGYDVE